MTFIVGAFGRGLSHEDGSFMNGDPRKIPMKETPESYLAPSSKKTTLYVPGSRFPPDTKYRDTLILGLPAYRIVRDKLLLLTGHPI